jgi:hypothetical protein
VGGDRVQVPGLVRAAAADGAALDPDRDLLRLDAVGGDALGAGLAQVQVDGGRVEGDAGGLVPEPAQQALGGDRGRFGAGDPEHLAAVADFHAQAQFDLAQVRVEGTGKVGQALGVWRIECEF